MPPTPISLRLDRIPAQVVEVVDGDTLRVVTGGKRYTVQLIGIDTPEIKHTVRGVDCFGLEAAEAMRQLVEGKTVYLEKDVTEADAHHRHPRYVYVIDDHGQELHVNWQWVWRGYAKAREIPPDLKYQAAYWEAQQEAEAAQRGLWAPETCAGQTKR